jgi:hypothetical protein
MNYLLHLPDKINVAIELSEFSNKFSISLNSERFPDCVLFRYDVGGSTHRNNFPKCRILNPSDSACR